MGLLGPSYICSQMSGTCTDFLTVAAVNSLYGQDFFAMVPKRLNVYTVVYTAESEML